MKLSQYYKNMNGEVTIGDVIRVSGSKSYRNKDGIYIMLSNEINPSIAQRAQSFNIVNNNKYIFCEFGGLSCQIGDENADVEILFNILKNNYKLNNNCMSLQNTIKKIFRQEPEKTFVEVGFIDENENMLEKGKEALLFLLWKEKKDELKKLADTIQTEEKTNR